VTKPIAKQNLRFCINILKDVAKNRCTPVSLKVKCIDRIALLEGYYQVLLTEYYGPNSGKTIPDVAKELDDQVEKMLKQIKEEGNAGKLP